MTEEQIKEIIRNYDFPKYYKWFYNFYKKYLSFFILGMFVIIAILMFIHNGTEIDLFNVIKGLVFSVFGAGLWALSAYLTKGIHLRIYLKKSGMSLTTWNEYTKGLTIDDLKNY